MTNVMKGKPGAGMLTAQGGEPDPRDSTWHDWVRVSRDVYNHYVSLPLDAADVAHRYHAFATASLVPHLVAQLEHSWTEIERWVKWWRDEFDPDRGHDPDVRAGVDEMLDDLRDHLVEGVPLHRPCGPNPEDSEGIRWTP